MTIALLISILSIMGLMFSLNQKGIFQKIIASGLCLSILITWIGDKNILLISMLLLLGLAVLTTIYSLTTKGLTIIDRITIGVTGLFLTIGTLAKIQLYPGQSELRYILIIPISLFILTVIRNGLKQPKEFGFMLIWITLAVIELLKELTR